MYQKLFYTVTSPNNEGFPDWQSALFATVVNLVIIPAQIYGLVFLVTTAIKHAWNF